MLNNMSFVHLFRNRYISTVYIKNSAERLTLHFHEK
jgi:hypothetical protein